MSVLILGTRRDKAENVPIRCRFAKQPQVNLEHRLKQSHVCALIQADLMFPHVDDEHLRRGEGEKSRLSLKILKK